MILCKQLKLLWYNHRNLVRTSDWKLLSIIIYLENLSSGPLFPFLIIFLLKYPTYSNQYIEGDEDRKIILAAITKVLSDS